jgi:hypothetical protein
MQEPNSVNGLLKLENLFNVKVLNNKYLNYWEILRKLDLVVNSN